MTTCGMTSFFSSITSRIPSRSLSSRTSLMPSIFFSRIELGDARGDARLVHLVRNLRDDDLFLLAAARRLLDRQSRPHDDGAAPGPLGRLDPARP